MYIYIYNYILYVYARARIHKDICTYTFKIRSVRCAAGNIK